MKTRKKRTAAALLLLLFLLLSAAGIYGYLRVRFPLRYAELVQTYAAEYELEPSFVLAVIWAESSFRPEATSHAGARGLMQIMPATGEWIAGKLGIEDFTADQLYDPETNIRLGCWYLGYLRERFGGNEVKMLAGYNAGPNNVKKWQEEWGEGHEPTAADIPFPETEQYVKKVCNAKLLYAWLYHLDEAGA